ncbi:hypothetical protein A6770_37785 [Nostoc minutum NIES-26]|uniref:Uncharacterized protein n=1 Tax=Nostoc minutum NIES-26 TaxID=1844469 RepID=A0A367RVK5_9NOSO|nr:hypothetical protein A6770_37785 [Nostoc minutum NIES-26]
MQRRFFGCKLSVTRSKADSYEHGKFVHTQEKLYYFVTFSYQHDDSFVEDEKQLSELVTYLFYQKAKQWERNKMRSL